MHLHMINDGPVLRTMTFMVQSPWLSRNTCKYFSYLSLTFVNRAQQYILFIVQQLLPSRQVSLTLICENSRCGNAPLLYRHVGWFRLIIIIDNVSLNPTYNCKLVKNARIHYQYEYQPTKNYPSWLKLSNIGTQQQLHALWDSAGSGAYLCMSESLKEVSLKGSQSIRCVHVVPFRLSTSNSFLNFQVTSYSRNSPLYIDFAYTHVH